MRRGIWITIAAVVVAVIVVAAFLAGRNSRPQAASSRTSTPVASSSAPSAATSGDTLGAAPTGCLGGTARTDATVLAAQKQAPHTAYGAVEVATAFFRWAYRYPYPSAASASRISAALIAPAAPSGLKDIAAGYASAGDITHGQVPHGTPFYLSTTNGLWLASGTTNRVLVTVNADYVISGQLSPTKTAAAAAVMIWSAQGWRMLSEQQPDTAKLTAGGTEFTGGC